MGLYIKNELTKKPKVYLVGCGLGDVDLLTIKAYKVIHSVDVVLYDHLISDEILQLVPPAVEKIYVGKQKGFHSKSQQEINELLINLAKTKCVARLKSGDPYIYGRGGEEAIALVREGVEVEVIAGISSAISAPLYSNIAITHRGYSESVSIVSAHLRGDRVNLKWVDLLNRKNHTVVVLMGISRVKEIVSCAIGMGIDENLDVAIISNASRKEQKTIITTLKNLIEKSKDATRPAILVFGECVRLNQILSKDGE